jgi:hypothetical protein
MAPCTGYGLLPGDSGQRHRGWVDVYSLIFTYARPQGTMRAAVFTA